MRACDNEHGYASVTVPHSLGTKDNARAVWADDDFPIADVRHRREASVAQDRYRGCGACMHVAERRSGGERCDVIPEINFWCTLIVHKSTKSG
jgi:hypothetical protein